MTRLTVVLMVLVAVGVPGVSSLMAQEAAPTTAPAAAPTAERVEKPAAEAAVSAASSDEALEEDFLGDQDQPPRKSDVFSLQDITMLTLKNNTSVKIRRINPYIAETSVTEEEAAFDPAVEASVSGGGTDSPVLGAGDTVSHSRGKSVTSSAAVTKRFTTGTRASVGATATHEEDSTSDSSVSSAIELEVTHPLLKGAGPMVNQVDIFIARNNTKISEWDFNSQVIDTIAQAQTTYWELVFALENLEVQKRSWRLSKRTLMQTEAQVEAGVLARIEITRVRADVASKEEGIISAQRSVEDQVDQLRLLIRRPDSQLSDNTGIVPLERVTYKPVKLALMGEISSALENRPDYVQAKLDTLNKDLELVRTRNNRLPRLDLTATLDVNGLGGNVGDSGEVLADGDHVDWNLGATFTYPLGNRAADAAYARARLTKIQSLLRLKNIEDQIVVDVKAAVRKVEADGQRIRSTILARQLAEERLAAEEEKLNVGQAIILDLLEAQTLVAQTEAAERRAIVDYQNSLIQLEKVKGTLLQSNRIHLTR